MKNKSINKLVKKIRKTADKVKDKAHKRADKVAEAAASMKDPVDELARYYGQCSTALGALATVLDKLGEGKHREMLNELLKNCQVDLGNRINEAGNIVQSLQEDEDVDAAVVEVEKSLSDWVDEYFNEITNGLDNECNNAADEAAA